MNDLEKRIQTYKYLIFGFLIVMIAGLSLAVYYYLELKRTKEHVGQLEIALQEAKDKLAKLPGGSSEAREDLESTVQLLEGLKGAGTDKIVDRLTDQAAEKRRKDQLYQEQLDKRRGTLIRQLYTPGGGEEEESLRKEASNELLRDYRQDESLIKGLIDSASVYLGRDNQKYQNSIWQTIYVLKEASKTDPENLKKEKAALENLFQKVQQAGLMKPGGRTEGDKNEVLKNIEQ